jgi:hypothetical protein
MAGLYPPTTIATTMKLAALKSATVSAVTRIFDRSTAARFDTGVQ